MTEKNIDAILQRLIRILSQEIVTYTKLLTSLEEKLQAIIQGKIENIQLITEKEQSILSDAKLKDAILTKADLGGADFTDVENKLFEDLRNLSSRKKRIAGGSGTTVPEVNQLIKQFSQMGKMMKMMLGGGAKQMMQMMKGGGGMPGMK